MNNQMNAYNSVLQFLRANNLREAEMAMVKECQQKNIALQSMEPATPSKILNSNPTNHVYNKEYKVMYLYIRESLDIEKFELVQFTFPIFANMFIECIEKNLINAANAFFRENEGYQEFYYKMYLTKLRCILNPQILNESQIYSRLRNNKYNLYINKKTFQNFASFLSINCRLIFNIIQNHFNVMTYTDFKDLKIYTSSNPYIEQSQVNVMPIKYGVENVLKKPMFLEPFRKKKKLEDDCINPDISRIPRPENSQLFKIYQEKLALNKEKRYNEYSPYTAMYTIMNGGHVITITVFSDDFSLILCGLLNGNIHAWTVGEANIKTMKPMFQLNQVDPTDNINIYDKIKRHLNNGQSHEKFIGHSDRVTGIATCMFRNLLISSSMDGTVRLWSLDVMHCISVYISKYGSILDIDYGLEGVYFATCSSNMAHLWITQKKSPVRMFVGHFGNVESIKNMRIYQSLVYLVQKLSLL
ncbi:Transcription initiation factor TFIID subunit 5 [Intoshia linei]|uniref:Transcription initiation factor TFIID subunit 5 n=1 Tax=Intoshia linei TaxID=1819745 RepID=A0A177B1Y2_9BILA|nr:Transcription initiation factor TFIID subunit 5 [Intoshia linei]